MKIKMNDGRVLEFAEGTMPVDMAKEYDPALYKAALAAEVDGELTIQRYGFRMDENGEWIFVMLNEL